MGASEARRARRPDLSEAAFEALLAALDPVRETAGERYESIRARLVRFFAVRMAPHPEELADETLNRVARRLAEGETIRTPDVARYFLGVARNVLHEAWDRVQSQPPPLDFAAAGRGPVAPEVSLGYDEEALACLERCLDTLPPESRTLLLSYHAPAPSEKLAVRRALAAQLGIGPNALRIRLHRLRLRVEACVVNCLARSGETTEGSDPHPRGGSGS